MATSYIDLNKLKRFMGYLYKRFLPLSGGTLTGALTVSGGIIGNLTGTSSLSTALAKAYIPNASDLNTYQTDGLFVCANNSYASSGSNYPVPYAGYLNVWHSSINTTNIIQKYTRYDTGDIYTRYYNGTWSTWVIISTSSDLSNYVPLTGGTLTGNLNFSDIGDITTSNKISWNGSTDGADIYYQTTARDKGNLVLNLRDDDDCYLRIAYNGDFKSYFTPADGNFHGNVTGNADTATTLQNARTIALSGKITGTATSFNGGANISIPITSVTSDTCTGNSATATSAGKLTTARTIAISGKVTGTATSFDGSANISIPITAVTADTCTGNSATATSASKDGSGNVIVDTYYKKSDAANMNTSLQASINSKQDKLTFDTAPTANSTNPVTSGGIKAAIDAKTVDLSGYYTKTEVDSAISTAISSITDGNNMSY